MNATFSTVSKTNSTQSAMPRLALGTVQFGYPYGISPSFVERSEVRRMLARAWEHGIDCLDTAPAYGDSEAVIGAEMPKEAKFGFISKTKALRKTEIAAADVEWVVARARVSAADLRAYPLEAILVHESEDLICRGSELLMKALRAEGIARRIGVSVYDPEILDLILQRHQIDIVQLPLNVFDQRFVRDGRLQRLASMGIEVHVRSVFLQGLLVRTDGDLPPRFASAKQALRQFHEHAQSLDLSPVEAAMLFGASQEGVSRLVIGVDSIKSLDLNARALAKIAPSCGRADFSMHALSDPSITDPRRWTP